tara:strand:- start:4394 stop:4669 length:276 start_codon:yes stop_codon:yes gene_type:complete
MPYITQNERDNFDVALKQVSDEVFSMGHLNYCITTLIKNYMEQVKEVEGKVGYFHYNNLIGVLECAKLELYRRQTAPYEDIKIKENGDVYG